MMTRLIVTGAILLSVFAGPGLAATREEAAIATLNERNIFFNEDEFLKAVKRGDDWNVKVFLQAGMHPDTKHGKEWYPLHIATFKGYDKVVVTLLEAGAWKDIPDSNGVTALMFASMLGHTKIADALIKKKANVNLRNKQRRTALMFAIQSDHLEIADMLLGAGAKAKLRVPGGESAISIAARTGRSGVSKLLRKHGYGAALDTARKRYRQQRNSDDKKRLARDRAHAAKMKDLQDRSLGRGKYKGDK